MRTRICLYVLLLAPLAIYWQTVFHEYGFRADYTALHESREDPGRLVKTSGAHGRPLYGALLETSFALTNEVANLPWLRLTSVLLLTLLGLVLWRQLYQSGWNEIEAAGVGLGMTMLPGAQALVGSASAWPQALTLLLALAGFSAIETEIERGGMKRIVALFGGCMIYTAAGLIYQANVLFALVVVASVLLVRTGREPLSDRWWVTFHVAAIAAGLGLSRLIIGLLFSNGLFQRATAKSVDSVLDYLRYPLPNALSLYMLNDDHHTGAILYWGLFLAVVVTLALGYRKAAASDDQLIRRRSIYSGAALVVVTIAICLVASDRISTYRVLFPLAGLVLVLMVHSLRALLIAKKVRPGHYASLIVGFLCIGFMAERNAATLLAEPQGVEWEIMRGAVLRAGFTKQVRVHIITASLEDRATERIYGDEFGSVSSESDAIAKDMFRAALKTRFPDKLPKGGSYVIATSTMDPDPASYDLLIDMRKLKSSR